MPQKSAETLRYQNPAGFRDFEVRFGIHATSRKMPRPPDTGVIQVNLASENTRVVRRVPCAARVLDGSRHRRG